MVRTLHTNKGVAFAVSDEDYDFVSGFCWYLLKRGSIQCNFGPGRTKQLCRIIAERAGIDCSNMILHIDRNRSNNQRSNLKAATRSQVQGTRRLNINNTSRYKGVHWRKDAKKWRVQIYTNGKYKHLGYYDTPEEGHIAYKIAAKKYFGEFANTGETHA